jgi:hypothetical protein
MKKANHAPNGVKSMRLLRREASRAAMNIPREARIKAKATVSACTPPTARGSARIKNRIRLRTMVSALQPR